MEGQIVLRGRRKKQLNPILEFMMMMMMTMIMMMMMMMILCTTRLARCFLLLAYFDPEDGAERSSKILVNLCRPLQLQIT
jgi:hypothetical protein